MNNFSNCKPVTPKFVSILLVFIFTRIFMNIYYPRCFVFCCDLLLASTFPLVHPLTGCENLIMWFFRDCLVGCLHHTANGGSTLKTYGHEETFEHLFDNIFGTFCTFERVACIVRCSCEVRINDFFDDSTCHLPNGRTWKPNYVMG